MSKIDPGEQVKFLVSCIGNNANGRPDFQAVADELGIVSKAAAQKRYERLLKSYGIKPGGGTIATNGSASGTPVKEKPTPRKRKGKENEASSTPVKKRTRRTPVKKEEDHDDDDDTKPKIEDENQEIESGISPESSLSPAPPSEEEA